ncbi:hypothetical protein GCM10025795_49340 [Verticiella sediminum]
MASRAAGPSVARADSRDPSHRRVSRAISFSVVSVVMNDPASDAAGEPGRDWLVPAHRCDPIFMFKESLPKVNK